LTVTQKKVPGNGDGDRFAEPKNAGGEVAGQRPETAVIDIAKKKEGDSAWLQKRG